MKNFQALWDNFPQKKVISSKCRNKQEDSERPFSDYCAIMLSECLIKSGINISAYKGNKCWSHAGQKHILLAEDLAKGLELSPPSHFGRMLKIKPSTFQKELKDKTGIIFFKDYWQRDGELLGSRSGDHIDLWNKDRISSTSMLTRNILEFLGRVSDLNQSKAIWFWEVR